GRLQGSAGSFSNSEDIALIAVLSIPLWVLIASQFRLPVFKILFASSSVLFLLISAERTDARAAIVSAGGMALVYFVHSGVTKKVLLAVAGVVIIPGLLYFVPQEMLHRLSTVADSLTEGQATTDRDNEAFSSTAGRRKLLLHSIRITIQHPLFGVG